MPDGCSALDRDFFNHEEHEVHPSQRSLRHRIIELGPRGLGLFRCQTGVRPRDAISEVAKGLSGWVSDWRGGHLVADRSLKVGPGPPYAGPTGCAMGRVGLSPPSELFSSASRIGYPPTLTSAEATQKSCDGLCDGWSLCSSCFKHTAQDPRIDEPKATRPTKGRTPPLRLCVKSAMSLRPLRLGGSMTG